jgi:hypothetical protein
MDRFAIEWILQYHMLVPFSLHEIHSFLIIIIMIVMNLMTCGCDSIKLHFRRDNMFYQIEYQVI